MSPIDDYEARERMLNRFRRLLTDLQRGRLSRNTFEPWEVDLLLDFDACQLEPRRREDTFRQYQRAVERQLESGPGPPMKFSQFLIVRARG